MESSFEFQKNEKAIWICSNKILFKATGEDTQGTYSLIEMIVEPQSQVPMHMHTKEDEGLYVIDGELSVNHGQATEAVSSGSIFSCQREYLILTKTSERSNAESCYSIHLQDLKAFLKK